VTQLARELEARRLASAGNVVRLGDAPPRRLVPKQTDGAHAIDTAHVAINSTERD
jgi:hypothetical protein